MEREDAIPYSFKFLCKQSFTVSGNNSAALSNSIVISYNLNCSGDYVIENALPGKIRTMKTVQDSRTEFMVRQIFWLEESAF